MRPFFLVVVLWGVSGACFSQSHRFDLAKAYEADGDFEKALGIYEDLYRADSTNLVISDRLKSMYKLTNQNARRIPIIQRQLDADSSDVALWAELADAYFRSKQTDRASWSVERALGLRDLPAAGYRILATMMIENRWFDRVESVYFEGRRKLKDDHLFTLDLASLYSYQGQTYKAAREFLHHAKVLPEARDYVRNQILQLSRDDTSYASVVGALEEEVLAKDANVPVRRLLIDVHFQQKAFERAFEQSQILDRVEGKEGLEVLNFANLTFQNQLYRVALKAYEFFVARYPNAPQAEMGMARCFENMDGTPGAQPNDSADAGGIIKENAFSTKAIGAYRSIMAKYPKSEWSAEARYRSGQICFKTFFDVDEALHHYQAALDDYPATSYRWDIRFSMAECWMVQGKLDVLRKEMASLLRESRLFEISDRATFVLGEIAFYEGNLDSGRAIFSRLAFRQDGLFVNDALVYVLLLQESEKEKSHMADFSKAMFTARKRKYSEAVKLLDELAGRLPTDSPLLDDVLFQRAANLLKQGRYVEAVNTLNGIVSGLPNSPLADLSQKTMAETLDQYMGDSQAAMAKYREFLVRFPRSIYVEPIRKRLRQLEQLQKKSS